MSAVVGINFVKYNTVNHSRIHQVASGYNGTRIINMCSAILNGTGRTVRSGHLSTVGAFINSKRVNTLLVTNVHRCGTRTSADCCDASGIVGSALVRGFSVLRCVFSNSVADIRVGFTQVGALGPGKRSLHRPRLTVIRFSSKTLTATRTGIGYRCNCSVRYHLINRSNVVSLPSITAPRIHGTNRVDRTVSST